MCLISYFFHVAIVAASGVYQAMVATARHRTIRPMPDEIRSKPNTQARPVVVLANKSEINFNLCYVLRFEPSKTEDVSLGCQRWAQAVTSARRTQSR